MSDASDMTIDINRVAIVCRSILASRDDDFRDRRWMLNAVKEIGIQYCDWPNYSHFTKWKNSSSFGLMQFPTEFADFLLEIARSKPAEGIEIGVLRGVTAYVVTAVLQRANNAYVHHLVDIRDQLAGFDTFKEFLNLETHIPATSDDFRGRGFDFVFIDGDHSYDGMMRDFLNVGRYAKKICCFHDINAIEYNHLAGGTVRAWQEIKASCALDHRIIEISHCPTPWMGIGIIETAPRT